MNAPDRTLILVVDDQETGRYVKARVLRAAGFEILEAGTGRDALRIVHELGPRVVVLDVQLPDTNGWDVCRQLKADPSTANVLVLQVSATFVEEADTVRALEGGADACLTEPIDGAVLVATVRALLRAREAEDALRGALTREYAAREAADAANRAKDEFLATLSHELRSPISTILTWAALLKEDRLAPTARERALDAIERNARLQVRLIDDLLDVSRVISGKLRLDMAPVDPGAVLQAALEMIAPAAHGKGVTVSSRVEPGTGALYGDDYRLQQVVWNLLNNAVKFTPRGGRVEVVVARREASVEIRVSDTGRGIEPEFLPHIFERFRQADSSSTRSAGGLGLGLAIVRHLTELHGGSVTAESAGMDRGSTFCVRLPVPALVPALELAAPREPVTTAAGDLAGMRVLLVDDEDDAREALSTVLRVAGATVISRASVVEALAALDHELPDVIVSDIAMPNQDGLDLIRHLRERPPERGGTCPAIALTAYGGMRDLGQAMEAGYQAHLRKPADPVQLTGAILRLAVAPQRSARAGERAPG
jgi:signal transduction histidine kinase